MDRAVPFGDNVRKEIGARPHSAFPGVQRPPKRRSDDGIAMIGLGKMGANMTTRLLGKGLRVVAFDVKEEAVRAAEAGGATGARPWKKWWGNCPPRAPSG